MGMKRTTRHFNQLTFSTIAPLATLPFSIRPRDHLVPTVVFAPAIARWLSADPQAMGEKSVAAAGTTVRDVLDHAFAQFPILRGYVVDERGALRHHVVAFVNGEPVRDKQLLSESVPSDGEVYVLQALSGG